VDTGLPTVTVVFLVFNRREKLRESLTRMLAETGELEFVVVDNASEDGSADMVERDFPGVRLIRRTSNGGISGWSDGFAVARGDWVLALDDDCYLPPGGLERAIDEAEARGADLVSFGVTSSYDTSYRFDLDYRTGLLAFWGCAVLMRRRALGQLAGYDPGIFVWANAVEFMLRFFDAGFRHLHLPEVVAVHMREVDPDAWVQHVVQPNYRRNTRNWAHVAARHLRARDALGTLLALLLASIRDALSVNWRAIRVGPAALEGFAAGLRRRSPVRAEVSRAYRRNCHSFARPRELSRPPRELARALPRELTRALTGRQTGEPAATDARGDYAKRPRYYPREAATLDF